MTKLLIVLWLLWVPISIIEPGLHLPTTCNLFASCIIQNFLEIGLFTGGIFIGIVLKTTSKKETKK